LLAQLSRMIVVKFKNEDYLKRVFIPFISPLTLIFLLLTIVLMFSLKGNVIVELPMDVLRIAIPLLIFFTIMFFGTFFIAWKLKTPYEEAVSVAFTASGNNFELA